jgi:hypothetical protein
MVGSVMPIIVDGDGVFVYAVKPSIPQKSLQKNSWLALPFCEYLDILDGQIGVGTDIRLSPKQFQMTDYLHF